jgi:hypothetical protein
MVSVLYIKLYNEYKPYVNDNDDELAEIGQYQIFFTFFGALILQNNLLSSNWDVAIGALLIMINFGVVVMAGLTEVRNSDEEGAEVSESEKAYNRSRLSYNKSLSFRSGLSDTDQSGGDASNTSYLGSAPIAIATGPRRAQRRRSSVADREAERQYDSAVQRQRQGQRQGQGQRQQASGLPLAPARTVDRGTHRPPPRASAGAAGAIELASLSSHPPARRSLRDHVDSDDEDVVGSKKSSASTKAYVVKADASASNATRTRAQGEGAKAGSISAHPPGTVSRATLTKRDSMAPDSDDDSDYEEDGDSEQDGRGKKGTFRL